MVAKKKTQRFDILISPAWRPMLRVLGVKPENAYAELTGDEMHVRFGRLSHTFSVDAIETASIGNWPLWAGIGPRYAPGTVGFVGTFTASGRPLTKMTMSGRRVCWLSFTVNWFTASQSLFTGSSKSITRAWAPPTSTLCW